jgi:hypothetical protein
MTNMQKLDLSYNEKITNDGIKGMVNMQKLNLCYNDKITNEGI